MIVHHQVMIRNVQIIRIVAFASSIISLRVVPAVRCTSLRVPAVSRVSLRVPAVWCVCACSSGPVSRSLHSPASSVFASRLLCRCIRHSPSVFSLHSPAFSALSAVDTRLLCCICHAAFSAFASGHIPLQSPVVVCVCLHFPDIVCVCLHFPVALCIFCICQPPVCLLHLSVATCICLSLLSCPVCLLPVCLLSKTSRNLWYVDSCINFVR